jgi:succinyl-CoA synthetase alpha subunit
MGILVKPHTRVVCFGEPTEACEGCTNRLRAAGTELVAVVRPEWGPALKDTPTFDTAVEAVRETDANAAIVDLPSELAADAMMEAIDAGLGLIVCRTHAVPARDMVKVINYLHGSADLRGQRHNEGKIWLLGPGSGGMITPGVGMVGSFDPNIFRPGPVAIASRSTAMAEDAADALSQQDIGQSTCMVTSSALIVPTQLPDVLGMLEADPDTEIIVMIGGVGGTAEIEAAHFIREAVTKPVVAYLPGGSAPAGVNIAAKGDFASAVAGEIERKTEALQREDVVVVSSIDELVAAVAARL